MDSEQLKEHARQLVARFSATGLTGMSQADVRLLLSEKQMHLSKVSNRCFQGRELHLNVPLKRALEGEISDIAKAVGKESLREILASPCGPSDGRGGGREI